MSNLADVLREHRYQESPPPGLYPEAPTVCGCGTSPESPPADSDYEWWIWHVTTTAEGRVPAGWRHDDNGHWIKVDGEERS